MQFKQVVIATAPLFDTHLHSVEHGPKMKKYGAESIQRLISQCAEVGLTTVCITDHVPLPENVPDPTPDKDCGIPAARWQKTLDQRSALKAYGKSLGIAVAFGGEFDFFPEQTTYYQKLDTFLQPDMKVLGLHFIDTLRVTPDDTGKDCFGEVIAAPIEKFFCFDFSAKAFAAAAEQRSGEALMERYFSLLQQALREQAYDSVAHLDLINKYNTGETYFRENEQYTSLILQTLQIMAEKKIALEINLGGTVVTQHLVPQPWIVQAAASLDIPITLGSDAHNFTEMNPARWTLAYDLLRQAGINSVSIPLIS